MAIEMNNRMYSELRRGMKDVLDGGTIKIYKGTIPTDTSTFDPTAHTADELLTYTSVIVLNETNLGYIYLQNLPTSTASQSGTATWYSLYNPSTPQKAIFGDVTDESGTATLRLLNTTITSGNSVQIQHFFVSITS